MKKKEESNCGRTECKREKDGIVEESNERERNNCEIILWKIKSGI